MALSVQEWELIQQRSQLLDGQLMSETLDHSARQKLQRENSYLKNVLEAHNAVTLLEREIQNLEQQKTASNDADMRELFSSEITEKIVEKSDAEKKLDSLLFPADELSERSAYIEIRAGTGGQEAALFASDLVKMYTAYATSRRWHASIADLSETDLGGIREVTLHIEGKGAYGALKRESGVHRVQRVPQTETAGRVHTSTATVAVFPEVEEVDTISINPADLRIDTYRAGGAGGQHVNRTDSAVRITHIPSGLVVACQDERSQHKNKAKAFKMLQSRLFAQQRESQEASMSQKRKEMVGSGDRAEKVRTYNFPQNRITDHQVDLTLKNLDVVMQGPMLQDIVEALQADELKHRPRHTLLATALQSA